MPDLTRASIEKEKPGKSPAFSCQQIISYFAPRSFLHSLSTASYF
jgi:hypothetical protein